jgi:Zn-finger nucleic acid-binding protein
LHTGSPGRNIREMILACPACDSRHDITGRSSGESFRCPCGATMKLAVVPPTDDELACPHCGAGVARTATRCARCSAALLVKACPRCLSCVLDDHKRCPACGAGLAVGTRDASTADGDRRCPRCTAALHARRIDDIVIDECGRCLGVFLDHATIKQVTVDRAKTRADALLGALPRVELNPLPSAGQKMYLPCPICHIVMNRRLFAAGTGVIIDVCRTHGTFFDAGELPLMIEFVMNGGLDQARSRTIERPRELSHVISRPLPTSLPVARLHHDPSQPRTAAGALIDFLASIFD